MIRLKRLATLLATGITVCTAAIATSQIKVYEGIPLKRLPDDARRHMDESLRLAKDTVPERAIASYYNMVRVTRRVDPSLLPRSADNISLGRSRAGITPTKIADGLYYIGSDHVGAIIMTTAAGIIQWDAMNNDDDAARILEPGYKALGLNPSDIRYIVVTHAHGDHYGGVNYFKNKYPAIRVLASDTDWQAMDRQRVDPAARALPPVRDETISDGQVLDLGGKKVTFYITPGHTAGTVSSLIPFTYEGHSHLATMFGGVGVPLGSTLADYRKSWHRFQDLAIKAGADAVLSTHPAYDGTLFYITDPQYAGKKRNPWLIGREGVRRYARAVDEATASVASIAAATSETGNVPSGK